MPTQHLSAMNLARLLHIHAGGQINIAVANLNILADEKLIEADDQLSDNLWILTPRGLAFVEMLLDTPLPVERWVDPRTLDAPNANNPQL